MVPLHGAIIMGPPNQCSSLYGTIPMGPPNQYGLPSWSHPYGLIPILSSYGGTSDTSGLMLFSHSSWAHSSYIIYAITMGLPFCHGLFYTMDSHSLDHWNQVKAIISCSICNGWNPLKALSSCLWWFGLCHSHGGGNHCHLCEVVVAGRVCVHWLGSHIVVGEIKPVVRLVEYRDKQDISKERPIWLIWAPFYSVCVIFQCRVFSKWLVWFKHIRNGKRKLSLIYC